MASAPQPFEELPQIVRQWHRPVQSLACRGMREPQLGRVQCQTRRFANSPLPLWGRVGVGGRRGPSTRTLPHKVGGELRTPVVVDRIAADRVARLREMDTNLMRPSRLEATGDDAVVANCLDLLNVGHGELAVAFDLRT